MDLLNVLNPKKKSKKLPNSAKNTQQSLAQKLVLFTAKNSFLTNVISAAVLLYSIVGALLTSVDPATLKLENSITNPVLDLINVLLAAFTLNLVQRNNSASAVLFATLIDLQKKSLLLKEKQTTDNINHKLLYIS